MVYIMVKREEAVYGNVVVFEPVVISDNYVSILCCTNG